MMRRQNKLQYLIGALLVCFGMIQAAQADMTYVQEQLSYSGGKKEGPYTITTHIIPSKMKIDVFMPAKSHHTITIVDLEKMKMISINSTSKKYSETDLDLWLSGKKNNPPELRERRARLTVTGETLSIQDYACTKIFANMDVIKNTSWVTPAIKTDTAVIKFNSKWAEHFKDIPYVTNQNALWQQYRKLDSFPVKVTIDIISLVLNVKIELELKSHNYDKISPAVFKIPKGYTPLPVLQLPGKADTKTDTGADTKQRSRNIKN